ncbi:MAG TPA: CoA ester lyase [Alphaproteobacteria bacterium]|jgi:citrate lyase subunit beta/citryl-CoA lyase|nr:CoA ester lyase [Alphaproteobacteria bacterium]MDP7428208.1 CoA ester lyase [Alphaproteobacteria bacterium]HJM50341.1 CoA ester lyase [Alphaproteobacteria bacterium]
MSQRPQRARRCQLSVPGSSEKMMTKAAGLGIDHVFLDLEDAVAPAEKPAARGKVVEALNSLDFGSSVRCVRINDLETRWAYKDVIEVVSGAGANLDTIMIPKVKYAHDVVWLDIMLNQLELDLGLERRIGIELLIEEVEGMQNIDAIAQSTPRLEAMVFGMGDYSASQGVNIGVAMGADSDSYPGDLWHYQRQRLVVACRVAGIDPIDGPFANFKDADGYRRECRRAMILGCVGKWAIHPAQAAPSTEIFSPTADEVEHARKIAAAYDEAVARGEGAAQVDGVMIDAATVRILQNTLDKADLYGL